MKGEKRKPPYRYQLVIAREKLIAGPVFDDLEKAKQECNKMRPAYIADRWARDPVTRLYVGEVAYAAIAIDSTEDNQCQTTK
jgi:hypothetical protein